MSDPIPRRPAQEQLGLLLDLAAHIDEGMWLAEPENSRLLYVNPACCRIWGFSEKELYRSPRAWLERVHPDERERAAQALQGREYRDDEYRLIRPDGSERRLRTRIFPLRGAGRIAGVCEDVTGRRQMQESLRRREAELLQAQKMEAVGRLAGGVAHDFNNMLTVILGYGEYIVEKLGPDSGLKSEAEQVPLMVHRAAALTRQLLAFSRKQVLQPKLLDLNAVTADLQKMLRRLIGDDIEISVDPAPDLGPVLADPGHLQQVIMNLAVNARDAMPRGGKLVIKTANRRLSAPLTAGRRTVPPGDYVVLSVSDTGTGMEPRVLDRLFEPFFTTKDSGKGTGLGLATIFEIVSQAKGHVTVESAAGQGSLFRVYLPRAEGRAESRGEGDVPAESLSGSETVVLVEDEKDIRDLVRRYLSEGGYCVLEASSAAEALWICGKHHGRIHLLLTDIVMSQMNGFELADHLEPMHPDLRIMFMSGYLENPVPPHRAATPMLLKPFSRRLLLTRVRQTIDAPPPRPAKPRRVSSPGA
ncbi:MAG: PAS domain-containing protein [Elusimicrobia bacterium]|nr:PAS domain-containing protein [Elusimicrobiota bacterium]